MVTLLSYMAAKDKELPASLVVGMFFLFSTIIGTSPGVVDNLPPLSTTITDLSNMIIGSKTFVWNQLPCEDVYIVDDHHVVITLDSVIYHMMAHGIPLSFMQDKNGICHTVTPRGSVSHAGLSSKSMRFAAFIDSTILPS